MTTGLKPTLWRTARALANVDRLNLLRLVSLAKGSKGVVELAAEANVSASTASTYLRALNARGLISVIRSGPYVYYGTGSDRSLPVAAEIQKSFARLFAIKNLPKDWASRLLPLLQAYSHPRREAIVRLLGSVQPIHYADSRSSRDLTRRRFSAIWTNCWPPGLSSMMKVGRIRLRNRGTRLPPPS